MLDNFQIFLKKDSEISDSENTRIIFLKDQHWHHPVEAHKKWRKENLNENDCHLWIENKTGEIVAYLNLVFLTAEFGVREVSLIGIGNVCIDNNLVGQGLGQLLMNVCNYYIHRFQMTAILLCKPSLLKFYKKSGWVKYDGLVSLNGILFEGLTMLNQLPEESSINIERNF